jgi:ankyrin repeat protein
MRRAVALERALRAGDLAAARATFDEPERFPELVDPYLGCTVLQLALFWSPPAAVAELLDRGADPNFEALDGFPALILVLLHREDAAERAALVTDLLEHGADADARGINDWTALHVAAVRGDMAMVRVLLGAGADPSAGTRIDDLTTPADEAAAAGHPDVERMLRDAEAG